MVCEKLWVSEQPTLSKRDALIGCGHKVVEDARINQCKCLLEPASDCLICMAVLRNT